MEDGQLDDAEVAVLRALVTLEETGRVQTVHAAAILTRRDFTTVYTALNRLFAAGHVTPNLRPTDTGRKAIPA